MTTRIGKKIQQAKVDKRVTKTEVDGLIQQATANKKVSKGEKKELINLLKTSNDMFDTDARSTLSTFLGETPPVKPNEPSTEIPEAKIRFGADWEEPVTGKLVAGGKLVIEYDQARATLRNTHNGFPAWNVDAYIKLNPSGQIMQANALNFMDDRGRPTNSPTSIPITVEIPKGTTSVEVWFRNWTGCELPQERWDSNYGSNYVFQVQQ
jgi:hypothetical protein